MKKLTKVSLTLMAIMFMSACGSTTSITGSYKAPGITQVNYKKIFISALNDKIAVRQSVETEISNYLNSKGYTTVKSTDVFPANFHSSGNDKDKDAVLKAIRETNSDAILTLALINKETETRYVPGSGGYPVGGMGYYGTFGAYYGYGYNSFYSPGYYTDDKIYFVETNLYDVKTENLVWSAQSKTMNPTSIDDFLKGYEKSLTEQFIKDGLGKPAAK